LFPGSVLPHDPLHRAFVTPEPAKPNYFFAGDRCCGELSVAFCSCAQRQKKRLPAVPGATTNMARKFRFLRVIACIQRNKAMFGYSLEILYGRIDVHKEKRDLAGWALLQRVFSPSRRLSKERISCLKSIDR
jgi:hypothetical protein